MARRDYKSLAKNRPVTSQARLETAFEPKRERRRFPVGALETFSRKAGADSTYEIADLHADWGDKDQAFRWPNTEFQERGFCLVGLKTDFLLDPIRSDPRYTELVHKVGLPRG
jgi:hypothetical protein